jgi:hypothetical protein
VCTRSAACNDGGRREQSENSKLRTSRQTCKSSGAKAALSGAVGRLGRSS